MNLPEIQEENYFRMMQTAAPPCSKYWGETRPYVMISDEFINKALVDIIHEYAIRVNNMMPMMSQVITQQIEYLEKYGFQCCQEEG